MVIITINGEIYKIKNLVNGKCYIGLTTVGIRRRFKEHCIAKSYIGSAIRKYGKDNFVISVIDYADNFNELQRKEIYYIDKYDTFKNGYNLTLGGEGNCTTPLLKVVLTDKMKKFRKYVEKEN
ncbi:GIY-YIG nuclease family protein [Staphylococcus simulans]|uniref:GIY-YIG nuclease family protein n=1 Tax=Staphylococcus simulans TaxID=1286 RepID=UPI0007105638|nr:GIY-YIG nuclease family protein [Staphylococcus simulans]